MLIGVEATMFIFNITMINVVLILVGPVNAWTFHFMDF